MTAPAHDWTVQVGADETSVAWDPPSIDRGVVFVCAHGAGGHMHDKSVKAIAAALGPIGVGVVRFNFLYRAKGSGRPDPMPRLLACLEAVVADARARFAPAILVAGGRSMGGRAASVFASNGGRSDGLLLLAYPLHPPGQPQKRRDAHLAAIRQPVLCINGTRDAFCDRRVMEPVLATLGSNWQMHWLEGADHAFHVLKRSGRTDVDVWREVTEACQEWLPRLHGPV